MSSVILNCILMFLVIGWTINAAVFQAKGQMRWNEFWMNAALAIADGMWLTIRLS